MTDLKRSTNILGIILGILIIPLFFVFHKNHMENLYIKYPKLSELDSFSNRIEKVFIEKGVSFIKCDSISFRLETRRNYNDKDFLILEDLSVGDTITKKAGNDTLFISNNSKQYYYLVE